MVFRLINGPVPLPGVSVWLGAAQRTLGLLL